VPFEGICLTDTFQLYEKEDMVSALLEDNNARRKRQKKLDIRVIVGNPPYSVGQGDQIREQKALNARRAYWLKRRGRIEATNGSTKEARGLRQFRIRGRLGAAIELSLDAVAHNLQKLFSVLQNLSEPKLNRSLRNAAMARA